MDFLERLRAASAANDSLLCVGLDPDPARIPARFGQGAEAIVPFNRAVIEATQDLVCAYKPNLGFYIGYGEAGIRALVETRRMIPAHIPVILDAKVGDIDTTSAAYARGYFDDWGFDAVTAHPYIGEDGLAPLLRYRDRAVFILAKTSNPGSGQFQDQQVPTADGRRQPLYLQVASQAAQWQSRYGTCALVVGATYPDQLAQVRRQAPGLPILVPGIGAQGGDLAGTLRAGLDADRAGLLINASRGITYAGDGTDTARDARAAAQRLRDEINRLRYTAWA